MATVEVPDVPEATVRALESQAAEYGLTLTEYLRGELELLVGRSPNAEAVARIARRGYSGGPTRDDIVEQIRRMRDAS
ncbi:hypothetical protein AB0M95_33795 [Sphaerisporangium sp. NPDC051017]|uniref:hypothetical protein n=1 Tax=Sphaerisporangium sp. NPDC051017 TaxID=3154636 RepID=UPI00342600F5